MGRSRCSGMSASFPVHHQEWTSLVFFLPAAVTWSVWVINSVGLSVELCACTTYPEAG